MRESVLLRSSTEKAAVNYASKFARDMDSELADKFIGMYVNMDLAMQRGRKAARILTRGVTQD